MEFLVVVVVPCGLSLGHDGFTCTTASGACRARPDTRAIANQHPANARADRQIVQIVQSRLLSVRIESSAPAIARVERPEIVGRREGDARDTPTAPADDETFTPSKE